jgi:C4-dicarboxylate transporter DctM subunit
MSIPLWLPFVVAALLLAAGVEIIAVLGIAAILYTMSDPALSFLNFGLTAFDALNAAPFLALPLYVLAGDLILKSGMADHLVRFSRSLVGALPGGTAITAVVASGFFAAISGSNSATVAAIGQTMKPPMDREGYPPAFTMATIAAAGTVGIIIPPSVVFIIYGIATGVSVSDLFLAGVVPGLLMVVALGGTALVLCRGAGWGQRQAFSVREVLASAWDTKWAIGAIALILGGIYGGAFTPTEAAAVAVAYCFFIGVFVTRRLAWRDTPALLSRSARVTGLIAPIVAVSMVLSQSLTLLSVPEAFVQLVLATAETQTTTLLTIMLIVLVVGLFIEATPALLVLAPLFAPLVTTLGMSPVHFGVMIVIGLTIGFITPPMGLNLFVASSVGGLPIHEIVRRVWPYVLALLVVWLAVAFYPPLSIGIL